MNEWQPIETAPKDGTPFLAFGISPGQYKFEYGDDIGVTRWKVGYGGSWSGGPAYPTHWMPLPPPPEIDA